jgi:cytochrome c-type biogenesis protein CcmH/NrfG
MTRDAIVFGVSGTMFGLLMGWIIGSQQALRVAAPAALGAPNASAAPASPGASQAAAPEPVLDERQAAELERTAASLPKDAAVRAKLADLYYDARRFPQAIQWYEASLKLDAKNVNVSTDLAAAYYYMNDFDRALKQIDHSL